MAATAATAAGATQQDDLAALLAGQATSAGLVGGRAQNRGRTRTIILLVVASLVALGIGLWLYERNKKSSPPSGGGSTCSPACTGDLICVNGQCKRSALSCSKDSDCGTCNTCVGGTCTPTADCCGGKTCAKGQQCYASDNTCRFIPGYCDASNPCPTGSECDTVRNICIERPRYGPDSGKGCFEGFGTWTWELDSSTGSGAWACSCANKIVYSGQNECSPLVSASLCSHNTENLDPSSVVPASKVPAFRGYGWGDQPVIIDTATASSPTPSPIVGACPCAPGWAGGSCTEDISCSGGGSWSAGTGCQCYQCTYTDRNYNLFDYQYRFGGPNCQNVTQCTLGGRVTDCSTVCTIGSGTPGCPRPSSTHTIPGLVCTATALGSANALSAAPAQ